MPVYMNAAEACSVRRCINLEQYLTIIDCATELIQPSTRPKTDAVLPASTFQRKKAVDEGSVLVSLSRIA